MAQKFSKNFYQSKAWLDCRAAYIASVLGMCERCNSLGKVELGYIVHHKILLTANNINDALVTLNHEHLRYLCLDCHNIEHGASDSKVIREGLAFDSDGNVVRSENI